MEFRGLQEKPDVQMARKAPQNLNSMKMCSVVNNMLMNGMDDKKIKQFMVLEPLVPKKLVQTAMKGKLTEDLIKFTYSTGSQLGMLMLGRLAGDIGIMSDEIYEDYFLDFLFESGSMGTISVLCYIYLRRPDLLAPRGFKELILNLDTSYDVGILLRRVFNLGDEEFTNALINKFIESKFPGNVPPLLLSLAEEGVELDEETLVRAIQSAEMSILRNYIAYLKHYSSMSLRVFDVLYERTKPNPALSIGVCELINKFKPPPGTISSEFTESVVHQIYLFPYSSYETVLGMLYYSGKEHDWIFIKFLSDPKLCFYPLNYCLDHFSRLEEQIRSHDIEIEDAACSEDDRVRELALLVLEKISKQ